jgi:hypothetical protein
LADVNTNTAVPTLQETTSAFVETTPTATTTTTTTDASVTVDATVPTVDATVTIVSAVPTVPVSPYAALQDQYNIARRNLD